MANPDDAGEDYGDDGGPVTQMIERLLAANREREAKKTERLEGAVNGG